MSFIVDAITTSPKGKIDARRIGEFVNHAEAVTAAEQLIDVFLYREYREGAGHGITAEKLLAKYKRSGEVPVILLKSEASTYVPSFDHVKYAARRCLEICGQKKKK